jgi:hypothetical protein
MEVEALHVEVKDIERRLDSAVDALVNAKALSMDIAPGFAEIPIIEIVRGIREGISLSLDTIDRLTRFALVGRTVTIKADGEPLGLAFTRASVDDPWETSSVLKEYPAALQFLFNVCEDYVLKKSKLPQKSTPEVAAGAEPATP